MDRAPVLKQMLGLVVVVDRNGLQVLGLEHLIALQAVDVVNAVPAGDHLCTAVIAGTFHRRNQPSTKDFKHWRNIVNSRFQGPCCKGMRPSVS